MSFYNAFDLFFSLSGDFFYYYFISFKSILLGVSFKFPIWVYLVFMLPFFFFFYIILFLGLNSMILIINRLRSKE